jgi:hypothetical protein
MAGPGCARPSVSRVPGEVPVAGAPTLSDLTDDHNG